MKKINRKMIFLLLVLSMMIPMFSKMVVEAAITTPTRPNVGDTKKYYDVTIYYNDDTNKSETRNIEYGTVLSWLPTPTRQGHLFEGWYTAETGGSQVQNSAIFNYTKSINLYAHWKPINVVYQTYIEGSGWSKDSYDGNTSGAVNQGKRLEGIKITVYPNNVANNLTGGIEYRVHQQDIGWHNWVSNGTLSGKVDDNW